MTTVNILDALAHIKKRGLAYRKDHPNIIYSCDEYGVTFIHHKGELDKINPWDWQKCDMDKVITLQFLFDEWVLC